MLTLSLSLLLSSLATVAAAPPVTVEGDATCPMPAEVTRRLGDLLRADAVVTSPDVARLSEQGGALAIRLERPDGSLIGERTLERLFPCADLAAATAVILATWESDVHPAFRPTLAAPPAVTVAAPAPTPPAAASTAAAFDVGGALSGSLAPGSGNAGGAIGLLLTAAVVRERLGGRLALQAGSERSLALGAGTVRWRRVDAALGPVLRFQSAPRAMAFDLHIEALGAWVSASGSGFPTNHSASSADLGAGGGLRLLFGARPAAPWIDVSACGWLRQEVAYADPTGTVTLPRIEATLALGLSFCACP